jgi:hypothetical protein
MNRLIAVIPTAIVLIVAVNPDRGGGARAEPAFGLAAAD